MLVNATAIANNENAYITSRQRRGGETMIAGNKTYRWSAFQLTNGSILIALAVITLYPLWREMAVSLSSAEQSMQGGWFLWPKEFTLKAYQAVFHSPYMLRAYLNSGFTTVVGTAISVLLTATTAYPLIKRGMPGNTTVTFLILFTMLFGGGIIPTYLLVKNLGLINSLWSLILPTAISAYNVIVMRSFFVGIPAELEESAMIDGANPLRIFFTIILPLSTPVLATIALWDAVGIWNNFLQALIYLNDRDKFTLPIMLQQIIIGQQQNMNEGVNSDTSTDAVIAATIILTILPILCVYPFLQKHFVKGVMIGAVKS
jgi:ABC-type glycerol-3-phosphate transport system permease component